MNQELGLLNTKLDQTKKKLNEARDYRNKANGDLAKIANKWGGIVEDGVIVNYKKIVEDQINTYNRAVETYNNSAQEDSDKEGYTLIPLEVYLKNNKAKVKIGVCKGKHNYDKRASLKEKELKKAIKDAY